MRDARIAPEVRIHLTKVEDVLKHVPKMPTAEQQVDKAVSAMDAFAGDDMCDRICAGRKWYAAKGKSLEPLDPCSMCRSFYRTTAMHVAEAPHADLFANRSEKEPRAWQCAESDTIGQLYDARQQRLGPKCHGVCVASRR